MKRGLAWIVVFGRVAAGGWLALGGFLKLRAPAEEFAAALEGYRLFPLSLTLPVARVLPWAEYLVGIYVIAGLWLRLSAPAALLLYGGFVASLGSALARRLPLDSCGCFGGAWFLPPPATLIVDSAMVLLLAAVVLDRERLYSLDRKLK
jgi:hypothetical protein